MSFYPSQLARQIAAYLQSDARGHDQMGSAFGIVRPHLQIQPRAQPIVDLADSAVYAQFFSIASEFALPPHVGRRPRASALNGDFKQTAQQWVVHAEARGPDG